MKKYHILNGDALEEHFPKTEIPGELIVIREAFIEGPLSGEFSKEYWEKRAAFVSEAYEANEEEYSRQFLSQLRLMDEIQEGDEVNLWFEDDLFCQTNMWFTIKYISSKVRPEIFRVFPKEDSLHWSGFGKADEKELIVCFEDRKSLNENDITFSNSLWNAYVENDAKEIQSLSFIVSNGFRFLPEVIHAHLDRNPADGGYGRPQQTLIEILNEGKTNFFEIYEAFWSRNSIYGFGDLQVLNMLKEMEIEFSEDVNP